MSFSDDSKAAPAALLLSEIEKLSAQTRLMEFHLERAHLAAEEKFTRLQEQIQQLDDVRRSHEEEIASLRHQIIVQERALTGRHEAVTGVELALHGRIQSLQQDLAQRLRQITERDSAIELLRCEAATLCGRIAEFESNTVSRESADAARQELETRLRDKNEQLTAAQSSARESEQRLSAKAHELQIHLADKQLLVDSRAAEIEDLRAAVTRLSAQLAVLDSANRAVDKSGATRLASLAKITSSKEQEFAMENDDHDKPLLQRAADREGHAPQPSLEQSLREEVNGLIREAHEKNQILQDRNEELVRVKAESDRLHERLNQLESSRSETENALQDDSARMRTEFQAQLALLQAELSQREWSLEEHQAEARGREQKLRQEIESLRQQLVENKAAQQHDADAFVFGEPRASQASEQHFEAIGNADRGDRYSGAFAQQRRWHSGFGWKRRWRS